MNFVKSPRKELNFNRRCPKDHVILTQLVQCADFTLHLHFYIFYIFYILHLQYMYIRLVSLLTFRWDSFWPQPFNRG